MAKAEIYWVDVPAVKVQPERDPFIQLVRVEKKKIVLVYSKGKWYAIQQKCPHEGGPMEGGWLNEEGRILCPWHRYAFDLETGQCRKGGFYLDTYVTRTMGNRLQLQFKRKKWRLW